MSGAAENYFSAFALHLRATTAEIGWLAALPQLIGSFAQLASAHAGRTAHRRKPLILAGAAAQVLCFVPLIALAIAGSAAMAPAVALLIVCVTLYYAAGHFGSPHWTRLMADLVPPDRRGRYFGHRTRIMMVTTFVSMALAGIALQVAANVSAVAAGFVVLFLVAAVARSISVWHLSRMQEPEQHRHEPPWPDMRGLMNRLRNSEAAHFSFFFACLQGAAAIAAPFFAVYMLRDLGFGYVEFMLNIGTAVAAQSLSLGFWGRRCDTWGSARVLRMTAAVIPVFPVLWTFSESFGYLCLLQALGGIAWSGFSLAANNVLLELVPVHRRTAGFAAHAVLAAVAIAVGSAIGGLLGSQLPASVEVAGFNIELISAIGWVFIASTAARTLVVGVLLTRVPDAARHAHDARKSIRAEERPQ